MNAQLDNTRSVAGWLRRVWPHLALPIALAVMVLAVSEDGYYRHLATAGCIAYVLTSSFNLVFGYAGIFSLASVALYGVGAYASVYAENNWGWSFWLAIVFAFVLSAALGGAIAAPTARLRSIFIAIVTLAFAVAVTEVFSKWTSVTGGAAGIYSITPPSIGETSLVGGTTEYLWLCAVVAWLVGDLMLRIHRSALGRKLRGAARDAQRFADRRCGRCGPPAPAGLRGLQRTRRPGRCALCPLPAHDRARGVRHPPPDRARRRPSSVVPAASSAPSWASACSSASTSSASTWVTTSRWSTASP